METVQVVLEKGLLQATDRAARRMKQNRSAWVREALREHLKRLEVRSNEERDREGFSRRPQAGEESLLWEAEAAWPAEIARGDDASEEALALVANRSHAYAGKTDGP